MTTATGVELPEPERQLLLAVYRSDTETAGRPTLPAEQVAAARRWLERILVDSGRLGAHIDLLRELYGATFRYRRPRRDWPGDEPAPQVERSAQFRHNQPLPDSHAQVIVEQGPDSLRSTELAALLLNPYALWDLADLIDVMLPDYWLDRAETIGQELIAEHGLDTSIPGVKDAGAAR
jgi:hypothetical protein